MSLKDYIKGYLEELGRLAAGAVSTAGGTAVMLYQAGI